MRLWLFDLLTEDVHDSCPVCKLNHPEPPEKCRALSSLQPNLAHDQYHNFSMEHDITSSTIGGDAKEDDVPGASRGSREAPESERQQAAKVIQRNFRGYRTRRELDGLGLTPSTRWGEAIKELQFRQSTRPSSRAKLLEGSDGRARAQNNWKKVGKIASRARADDSETETDGPSGVSAEELEAYHARKREIKAERERTAKQMDLQYWLELVDDKHRYGSHLRTYHQEWLKRETHENFFYWLDYGEGRNLDLPLVSRACLDADRVRYLSREERQNYLVRIDKEGRLCWAQNGLRITTSTAFKDSVDGIVPRDDIEHKPWALPIEEPGNFSSDDSSTMSTGSIDEEEGQHYVNHDIKKAKGLKKLKYVSAATIFNQLLQKTVKPNSWIFVADTSFRLYVGIKQSGSFQHSSFLHGSRISAAGLIKIKDGQLRALSPLSGHYRPPTRNFRVFVHSLKDAGVDMSRVSISRSYAILVGLEAYVKTRRKIKHGAAKVEDGKEKVVHPEEAKKKKEEQMDKSQSAQREREYLEEQQRKQEELRKAQKKNKLPYRIMNRFRSTSSRSKTDEQVRSGSIRVGSANAPRTAEGQGAEDGIAPDRL